MFVTHIKLVFYPYQIMKNSKKIYSVNHTYRKAFLKVIKTSETRNFHCSLKWVLFVAQCFAQIPVMGISKPDAHYLKFTWRSWRVLYCFLNIIGSGFLSLFYVIHVIIHGSDIYKANTIIFHLYTFLITIFFLKLARAWPELMHKWSNMECSMRNYGWPKHLHTRITVMSTIVLGLAATETTISKVSKILMTVKCRREDEEFAEYYFTRHLYYDVFKTLDYALWKAVLLTIENLLMTFAWTFNDLFIMLISSSLALRLQQITDRLRLVKNVAKSKNVRIWKETREDYNRLSQLTKEVDDSLSYIILTSFASNLFFILVQLFHSLRAMKDTLEKVYFFISFGLLITRTVCVSIYGAWIYDESREPLVILNSVSSDVYNIEIKRFIEQIKFDTVALTGRNFFYITRGMVLSMAGAIITYELVLIQFNENLLNESALAVKNQTGIC